MRRLHTLSGSKVGLAMADPYVGRADLPPAAALPQDDEASAGTRDHAFIAATIDTRNETPHSAAHATWLDEWWAHHKDGGWQFEVAIAYSPSTGRARLLPNQQEHRDYGDVGSDEIPLTIDAVRFTGETVEIRDWKCGFAANVAPASINWQLRVAAVAFCALYGASSADVGIVKLGGQFFEDRADVDGLDLLDVRMKLGELIARIPNAEPVAGPHCRAGFCDRFGQCPATAGGIAAVEPPDAERLYVRTHDVVIQADAITGPDHAAYQYAILRAVAARAALAWEALRQYADRVGGFDVGGGNVWSGQDSSKETIDLTVKGAVEALRGALGVHADKALELSTTKSAITTAARVIRAETGVVMKVTEAKAIAALDAAGAVKRSKSRRYEERPARALKAAGAK